MPKKADSGDGLQPCMILDVGKKKWEKAMTKTYYTDKTPIPYIILTIVMGIPMAIYYLGDTKARDGMLVILFFTGVTLLVFVTNLLRRPIAVIDFENKTLVHRPTIFPKKTYHMQQCTGYRRGMHSDTILHFFKFPNGEFMTVNDDLANALRDLVMPQDSDK